MTPKATRVQDSRLCLKMVGKPLNSFKQKSIMTLDRKAPRYCLNCHTRLSLSELCQNLESEIVILEIL